MGWGWESIPYHICEIRKLAFNQTSVSLHVQEENMVLNLLEVIGLENLIPYGPIFIIITHCPKFKRSLEFL